MAKSRKQVPVKITLEFEDNMLLPALFGEHHAHLSRLEQKLDVQFAARGNQVAIEGDKEGCATAQMILNNLYERLGKGLDVEMADVDGAIRMAGFLDFPRHAQGSEITGDVEQDHSIRTRKTTITARSKNQARYIDALRHREMTFGLGPAGTGKTFLAVAMAVSHLLEGKVERIILSRPAVEAGEKLGFLPGDLKEKVDPYLRPLYDALAQMISMEQTEKRMERGDIEVAPLAFMRGRTLSNAFVILDEAQNTTPMQMKMLLTRFGENCHMVVCGDPSQTDLPEGSTSGLTDAIAVLRHMRDIDFIEFDATDVVRHPLVGKIVRAYDKRDES